MTSQTSLKVDDVTNQSTTWQFYFSVQQHGYFRKVYQLPYIPENKIFTSSLVSEIIFGPMRRQYFSNIEHIYFSKSASNNQCYLLDKSQK